MKLIQPGEQEVIIGSGPSFSRVSNSWASSMIVRSAPKSVSKTRSKPSRRSAVIIWPVAGVPGASPKPSPMAARIDGAVCTTTCISGLAIASQTGPAERFSRNAAVGQTLMHWPHWMQTESSMLARWAGPTTVVNPRPCWLRL